MDEGALFLLGTLGVAVILIVSVALAIILLKLRDQQEAGFQNLQRHLRGIHVEIDGLRSVVARVTLRGISRNVRTLRYLGLALFAIVTWKVFAVELSELGEIYRIVAFVVLGILVLTGSFIYLRYRDAFKIEGPGDANGHAV
ncbi:MAG: DUF2339 domain-containing protein [Planctomycetaceae bacterium]|nr:DUF2339 domain-containing protein [Planctomycetaceae bacterium]